MKLSNVNPDYDTIVQQLQSVLQTTPAFSDLLQDSTGMVLLEWMASIGTFIEYNLERAVQENFLETALSDTSIYAAGIMLGAQPKRFISSTVTVTLNLPQAYNAIIVIPALSQFTVGGVSFFNQNSIVFSANQTQVTGVLLEQGTLQLNVFSGSGQPYQSYFVSANFQADENLMNLTVNGQLYIRERNSLWTYAPGTTVYLETTMPDGSVRIDFPGSIQGTIPPLGSSINITWSQSLGYLGNIAASNLTVTLVSSLFVSPFGIITIAGVSTSTASGGSNQEPAANLAVTAPRIFAAGGRAITRNDYRSIAIQFAGTGISDCLAYGEFEVAPLDNSWNNVVGLTILPTNDTPTGNLTVGAGNGSTLNFSGTLTNLNILTESFTLNTTCNTVPVTITDNGFGILVGSDAGAGTINYITGVWAYGFKVAPDLNISLIVTYSQLGLTPAELASFIAYIDPFIHLSTQLNFSLPQDLAVNVAGTVTYTSGFDPNLISAQITNNLNNILIRSPGILGQPFYYSSVYNAMTIVPGVDHVELTSPVSDIFPLRNQFCRIASVNLNINVLSETQALIQIVGTVRKPMYRGYINDNPANVPGYNQFDVQGDYYDNSNPIVGSPDGWVCIQTGANQGPGVWVSRGIVGND